MNHITASSGTGLIDRARLLFAAYAEGRSQVLDTPRRNAALFWAVVTPIANLSLLGWLAFYLIYDAAALWPAAALCAGFQITFIAPLIARRSRFAAEAFACFMIAALFTGLMWVFGATSGLTYGLLPAALILVMEIGTRRFAPLVVSVTPLLVLFWALPVWFPNPQPFTNATPWLLDTIQFANVSNLIIITLAMVILILRRAEDAEAALALEYNRSEALLANLVPEQIAMRLKNNPGEVIADENAEVTVVFADIVGFTPKAARMRPEALVGYLNRVFSVFDALTQKHGLEKIKTIGDAYMAVAGMPTPRNDHARAAAALALDMLRAAAGLSDHMGEAIDVRIGLHTGAAVGGVIGTTKVFYDVWGDTVNTAARMESLGQAGRVHVTDAVRRALGDTYAFEARGLIDVKGKGQINTFWLTKRSR